MTIDVWDKGKCWQAATLIGSGFSWGSSREGFDFWAKIARSLRKMAGDDATKTSIVTCVECPNCHAAFGLNDEK